MNNEKTIQNIKSYKFIQLVFFFLSDSIYQSVVSIIKRSLQNVFFFFAVVIFLNYKCHLNFRNVNQYVYLCKRIWHGSNYKLIMSNFSTIYVWYFVFGKTPMNANLKYKNGVKWSGFNYEEWLFVIYFFI